PVEPLAAADRARVDVDGRAAAADADEEAVALAARAVAAALVVAGADAMAEERVDAAVAEHALQLVRVEPDAGALGALVDVDLLDPDRRERARALDAS